MMLKEIYMLFSLVLITKLIEDNLPNLKLTNIKKGLQNFWRTTKVMGFLILISIFIYLVKGGKLTIPTRLLIYISVIPATLFIAGLLKRKPVIQIDTRN
jgi:hypothetical protein